MCNAATLSVTKALQNSTYLHTILHLIPSCQLECLQKVELVSSWNQKLKLSATINQSNTHCVCVCFHCEHFEPRLILMPVPISCIPVERGDSSVPGWDAAQETSAELPPPCFLLLCHCCCGLASPAAVQQQQLWPWCHQAADCAASKKVP